MSKKVNPAAVGLFVAGALVILLAGLVVLGSGKLFEERGRFVVYFQSSANGLDVGSDVRLGGVKIGSVVTMHLQFDPETNEKVIPVVIELSADRIAAISIEKHDAKDEILSEESIRNSVENRGLRARLMNKSALTGQLFVDLDFFPDEAGEGYAFPGPTIDGLTQIPTTKNEIQRVLESIAEGVDRLGKIDIGNMIENVDKLIVDLDTKINELDLKGISDKANSTLEDADAAVANINELITDEKVDAIVTNLNDVVTELKRVVAAVDPDKVNLAVDNAAVALEKAAATMDHAGEAIDNIGAAAGNVANLTDANSASMVRLNRALSSIEEAARSLKDLTDYLKRNPNALLSGKKKP